MQMTEMMVMIDNYGDGDDNNVEQGWSHLLWRSVNSVHPLNLLQAGLEYIFDTYFCWFVIFRKTTIYIFILIAGELGIGELTNNIHVGNWKLKE